MTKPSKQCFSLRWRFLIIVLLLLGIFFRCFNLNHKIYWHDEVYTSIRSSGYTGDEVIKEVFDGRVIGVEDLQKYQHPNPEKNLGDTINALTTNPEHPPLYYLMARFWRQLFGAAVNNPRGLSVLFSLLVLPAIYWLCLELFESPLVGSVAVALLAVSPFHVLYAQEAREYSLWTLTIILSCASLLRAIRKTKDSTKVTSYLWSWVIYAITLALSLYTFLFSIFVAIGHGIYVFIIERFRFNKTLIAYLISSGAGFLAFSPWLVVVVINLAIIQHKTHWTTIQVPLSFLVKIWGINLSLIFFDIGIPLEHPFTYIIPPILVSFVGYAIYFICRYTTPRVWLLVLTLILITALGLILPDLIWGGRRSVASRYFLPCYIGVQLAVAYLITMSITGSITGSLSRANLMANLRRQKVWKGIVAVLLTGGVISCAISSQAEIWWNKQVGGNNPTIARIINKAERPLVVSNVSSVNPGDVISLSYLLNPQVKLQLVIPPTIPDIPQGFSDVFLFYPSDHLQQGLEEKYSTKIEWFDESSVKPLGKLRL
ncbi:MULTISPECIES: glycosyltransferase family 39 protein [unclassified Moorena]|uniref:glycosyltransferase family 39 protein n=1 Tax=unclassified Moorena TaxID=2683338 RepID=UPI0013CD273D|nr:MULTISPECIES: glycosyltransferase family 39 protein [unclassified Moorena]NEO21929.1 hypothetical protein [Moorena sp. SIO4A5]NEQ56897.1 hypothetical protein [Moorena sp. SIO4A1]